MYTFHECSRRIKLKQRQAWKEASLELKLLNGRQQNNIKESCLLHHYYFASPIMTLLVNCEPTIPRKTFTSLCLSKWSYYVLSNLDCVSAVAFSLMHHFFKGVLNNLYRFEWYYFIFFLVLAYYLVHEFPTSPISLYVLHIYFDQITKFIEQFDV